jgi:hypothetical protein
VIAGLAVAAALAACPADVPPAMALDGVPQVLVAGKSYEVGLLPTGAGTAAGRGWTLGVFDRTGRGWSADLPSLGFRQAFSVGLTGAPYAVSGEYLEGLGETTCTRKLSVSVPVERRVLGVVACRRGEVEPRSLTLGCDGKRLRLRSLTWRGWNDDVAVGHTASGTRVRLSRPRECSELDGFIYTRARVQGRSFLIDCPILD